MSDCLCCSRTTEQGLVASVCGGQWAQALLPLVQNSAQMACVAQASYSHTLQVHRLHKMAQQRPLQAQDVPSEGRVETRESGGEERGKGEEVREEEKKRK